MCISGRERRKINNYIYTDGVNGLTCTAVCIARAGEP